MFQVRWETRLHSGGNRARMAAIVAGAALLAAGCRGQSDAGAAATRGPGGTAAPTSVVTTVTTTTTSGTRPSASATTRPPGAAPALPTGAYVGRFSAVDVAHKKAELTVSDSDPECSGPKSGTFVVDLTHMSFVGNTSADAMGQAYDLTLEEWADGPATADSWIVINLPGHEVITNGASAGCHP